MAQFLKRLWLMVIALVLCVQLVSAQTVLRIGILGDSNSDEYRANDNRGGSYAATTLSWVELLQAHRGVDVGTWGSRSEPRRVGYANNWARSGATAGTMISSGQHTGLAAQIAANQINIAIIYIGQNDFHTWNNTYQPVYNGTLSGAALQSKINGIIASITTAVDTLLAAGSVDIYLFSFGDPSGVVNWASFPDASKRALVTNATLQVNSGLNALAVSRGITIVDLFVFPTTLPYNGSGTALVVGGETITFTQGNEPHNFRLGDSVGHPGTVVNGLIANYLISQGLPLTPFSSTELLVNAGIGVAPTVTATPTATFTATFTPTPTNTDTPLPTFTFTPTFTPVSSETPTPNCGV